MFACKNKKSAIKKDCDNQLTLLISCDLENFSPLPFCHWPERWHGPSFALGTALTSRFCPVKFVAHVLVSVWFLLLKCFGNFFSS